MALSMSKLDVYKSPSDRPILPSWVTKWWMSLIGRKKKILFGGLVPPHRRGSIVVLVPCDIDPHNALFAREFSCGQFAGQ